MSLQRYGIVFTLVPTTSNALTILERAKRQYLSVPSILLPMLGECAAQEELAFRQAGIGLTTNLPFPCQLKQAAPWKESLWNE